MYGNEGGEMNPEAVQCVPVHFVWAGRSQDHGDNQNCYPASATHLTFTHCCGAMQGGRDVPRREDLNSMSGAVLIGAAQHINLWQLWKSVQRLAFISSSLQQCQTCQAIFAMTPPAHMAASSCSFCPVFGCLIGTSSFSWSSFVMFLTQRHFS